MLPLSYLTDEMPYSIPVDAILIYRLNRTGGRTQATDGPAANEAQADAADARQPAE